MTTLIILLFSVLATRLVESDTDDKSGQTKTTVSECLRSKWEFWVSYFDINRDGIISEKDLNKARKEFSILHKLTGEDKKVREKLFTQWWTEMILWNKREISVNEFVTLQSNAYLEDKDHFVEKMRACEERLVDVLNVDNDDYISEKEETIFLKIAGLTDEKIDQKFFKGFDPEYKGVPLEAMSEYWIAYLTDDDCSKTYNDPMKQFSQSS